MREYGRLGNGWDWLWRWGIVEGVGWVCFRNEWVGGVSDWKCGRILVWGSGVESRVSY